MRSPRVHDLQHQIIQGDAILSEHRFETLLRERFAFLQQQDRNSCKQEGRESARSALTKNRSKGKDLRENTTFTKSADGVPPSTPAKSATSTEKQDVMICGECDKRGHMMANCPPETFSSDKQPTIAMAAEPDEDPEYEDTNTLAISTSESSGHDIWISDPSVSQRIAFSRGGV